MNAPNPKHVKDLLLLGRSEWCQLSKLAIPAIKAKIDTGAKTSALHAFNIKHHKRGGKDIAVFELHPIQANDDVLVQCRAEIVDERLVMSSNGHKESRLIIRTPICIGDDSWEIELSLSNRDPLRYRMLLGREALNHRALINPAITCNQGKITKKMLAKIYAR